MELPASTDWQVSMPFSFSDRLPNDVVLDILVRLPVKSIVRFKCVSKPWCSLLSHPEFVLLHLQKATQGNKSLLFRDIIFEDKEVTIKWYPEIGNVEVYLVNEAEDYFETDPNIFIYQGCLSCFEREVFSLRSKETIEELGRIQVPAVPSPTSSHFLVGCLNGLICVAEAEYREIYHPTKIFFWNPATKEIRLLPRYCTRRISGLDQVIALGFGYEPATDDYKVIRIRSSVSKNVHEAETYSLRNNRWTETSADMISNCNFPEQVPQANVHGALHWMVHQGKFVDYVEDHILAFDIGKEELYRIPLPSFSSEYNPDYFCRNISVYQEHLALFSYLPFAEVKPLDIWVMKEYGKSWTKVKRVRQQELLVPMHFIDQNRAIMMNLKDWQLVLTDASFRRIRDLGLFNFRPIFEYVESLVSP